MADPVAVRLWAPGEVHDGGCTLFWRGILAAREQSFGLCGKGRMSLVRHCQDTPLHDETSEWLI